MRNRTAEQVYDTLTGYLLEGYSVPGVENAFLEGAQCEKLYKDVYDAYGRICRRLGI